MEELIKKLEEAQQGNWVLNESIAIQLGYRFQDINHFGEIAVSYPDGERGNWQPLPDYTRSLDGALSLVPKNWRWYAGLKSDHQSFASITDDSANTTRVENVATPALALTIAALRARMAVGEHIGKAG